MISRKDLSETLKMALHDGMVIPAHPLALTSERKLSEKHQRALTRYYIAAGSGGIAVGVHSTQFAIRDQGVNLFEPVLRLAAEEVAHAQLDRPFLKIAGICGPTEQALAETEIAVGLGYDIGIVSMAGLEDWTEEDHLLRIQAIAERIPVFGFYMQPLVGGRVFSYDFWERFAAIDGVIAIKIAPFNRYHSMDVVRAVCHSPRRDEIALYTGNDDNIVSDLLTKYRFNVNGQMVEKRIVGGLLGHWSVWTKKAVELLEQIKRDREGTNISTDWLTRTVEVTETNAAFFDPSNNFAGCIPGTHEVLRRQGLLPGIWCLDPQETLSKGQSEEIDRMYRDYPHLNDDEFVEQHLQEWLAD
ncbi:dihydrodipicolinate synthase family protein [Paenibacillus sp. J2TS4]|uniref:dihydrodipicolinate synthase family protein n=1 Tax=Paenibacillus sp. J2TS4 TaxID=2807194 RepID=UPI001B2877B8|nr:dihydrodipicolinate synthase family protein [Paenibacillus sp. J2TS4]GIP31745.1 dihydrodipicolinate synthetase [Paenibacillus sp. J2TS4]